MDEQDMVWYIKERLKEGARLLDIKHELQGLIGKYIPILSFQVLARICPKRKPSEGLKMIHALMKLDGSIVSPSLPKVGETIYVESFGHALVESIFHTDRKNFIRLEFQETVLGKLSQVAGFEVIEG